MNRLLDTIDDGGLPRHIVTGGHAVSVETRWDFSKDVHEAEVQWLSETGEPVEVEAMNFHAQRFHPSATPEGAAADFIANGLPPQWGAPFADPCMLEDEAIERPA